jgi:predicted AAA+ superfamily ATPase
LLVRILRGEDAPAGGPGEAVEAAEVLRGGMPPVRGMDPADAALWFRGFEQTYIERDIRDLARVDDPLAFASLLRLAAARTGQILNASGLARDARVNSATAARYLRLAEASFLLRRLPPYLRNRANRLVKSPKLYVADSGIACHLAGIATLDRSADAPLRGVLLETYILQNISSLLESALPDARVCYWHVQGRHEVDFVVEQGNRCVALEIKSATRWSDGDLSSLRMFLRETPACVAGLLVYGGNYTVQLGERLWAVPSATAIS